jgi:hypothetical protein
VFLAFLVGVLNLFELGSIRQIRPRKTPKLYPKIQRDVWFDLVPVHDLVVDLACGRLLFAGGAIFFVDVGLFAGVGAGCGSCLVFVWCLRQRQALFAIFNRFSRVFFSARHC